MRNHEDAGIAAKILDGNIEFYADLMSKYQESIFSIVVRRVPGNDVSALVHETFVQAYQSLAAYSGNVPFGNWAARIAIRTCCAYWRRKYRHKICLQVKSSSDGWNRYPLQIRTIKRII